MVTAMLIAAVLAAAGETQSPDCRPPTPVVHEHNVWCAALVAWGEARGDGDEGMAMVVQVLLGDQQRAQQDACAAAAAPGRFHVWSNNPADRRPWESEPASWCAAVRVTRLVYAGLYPFHDPVCAAAATHFHSGDRPSSWAGMSYLCRVGGHHYYREKAK